MERESGFVDSAKSTVINPFRLQRIIPSCFLMSFGVSVHNGHCTIILDHLSYCSLALCSLDLLFPLRLVKPRHSASTHTDDFQYLFPTMAVTRSADGTSRPRVFPELSASAPTKQRVTKKKASSTTTKVKKAATEATKKAKATAAKAKKETEKKVTGTKANTSKPRAKKETKEKVAKGRVEKTTPKKKEPITKRDTTLLEKAEGAVEYVAGVVQGKPGKKVCLPLGACQIGQTLPVLQQELTGVYL